MKLLLLPIAAALAALASLATAQATTLNRSDLRLTFHDEFDKFQWIDPRLPPAARTGVWHTYHPFGLQHDRLFSRTFPNNREMQTYIDAAFPQKGKFEPSQRAVSVRDGMLTLRAEKNNWSMRRHSFGRPYSSGMISSWGTFSQLYGVFEMRARIPSGRGLWPAFWLLPVNSGGPPELDIMEVIGHEPNVLHTTVHSNHTGRRTGQTLPHNVGDLSKGFHVYAAEWTPQQVIFYLDDREIARVPTPPDMHKPMYLIANLAVGGSWPGPPDKATRFPATMEIDWIRVYQRRPAK